MSRLPSFLVSPPPSVGVEIAADRVTAVSLAKQGAGWTIAGYGTERLPPGVLTPTLNATNVHDSRALAAALRSAATTPKGLLGEVGWVAARSGGVGWGP